MVNRAGEVIPLHGFYFPSMRKLYVVSSASAKAFSSMSVTYRWLCKRLGVDEDPDEEMIIDGMFAITRTVGEKMFEYGALYEKEK